MDADVESAESESLGGRSSNSNTPTASCRSWRVPKTDARRGRVKIEQSNTTLPPPILLGTHDTAEAAERAVAVKHAAVMAAPPLSSSENNHVQATTAVQLVTAAIEATTAKLKNMKACPACGNQCGNDSTKCSCNHVFTQRASVAVPRLVPAPESELYLACMHEMQRGGTSWPD